MATSKVLKISKNLYLGKGGTKLAYLHPEDTGLCIKFPRLDKRRKKKGLLREIRYLEKHQDTLPFLSKYVGTVPTDLGTGYLYTMIKNEDGSPSAQITKFLKETDGIPKNLQVKIKSIYDQLLHQRALIDDSSLSNIFISKKLSGDYDIYFIDGFGNSDFIKICDYSKFFLKIKLTRKFKKLCWRLKISSDFLDS